MPTLPKTCKDINEVGKFCGCLSGAGSVDAAAAAFCERAAAGNDRYTTGDDLVQLKKALQDLDEEEQDLPCGCV